MNEKTNERKEGAWMNEMLNKRMIERINVKKDSYINESNNARMNERMKRKKGG